MQVAVRQGRQFRNPTTHVSAVSIEFLPLQDRVEDSEIRCGIRAASRHPLPTRYIVRKIRVNKGVPKPGLTMPPVNQQVFDEHRGGNHAYPIVHPTGLPQLTHPGIDDREPRLAGLPGPDQSRVILPGKACKLRAKGFFGQVGEVEQQVGAEFTPADFPLE